MTPLAVTGAVWLFILLPIAVIWIIGLVDVVRRDLSREAKIGWILIVVLLPVVGTLVYFLLRKPTEEEIRRHREAAADSGRDWRSGVGPRPPVD
jgi:hypothetical protein